MTLTLYEHCVVLECDHPDCGSQVIAFGAGVARSLAKEAGWRERERPWCVDNWWLCPEHKLYLPKSCATDSWNKS